MSDLWPDGITADDGPALDLLADAEIGEGDMDGDACDVPADLLELYEVLEWQAAVEAEGGDS